MVHQVKRNHLGALDSLLFLLKKRMNKYLIKYPKSNLRRVLKNATASYNSSINSAFHYSPQSINDPKFDPLIRRIMYGPDKPLEAFDEWLEDQLKLQKIVNQPRIKVDKSDESYTQWRKSDKVLVNFNTNRLSRGYFKTYFKKYF